MKKLFLSLLTIVSFNTFSQISLTGQLTIGDANSIGNASNYIKIRYITTELNVGDPALLVKSPFIIVSVSVWKSKASYSNGKPALQAYDTQVTNEIKSQYLIDATAIATSASASFNAVSGKSIHDKEMYWIAQKVLALIIADNPTFTGSIVDINL